MNRRDFHRVVGSGAVQAALNASLAFPQEAQKREWYASLTPGIHLDYHFPEWDPYILSKAEGTPMIQQIAATGAELVVVFAKCHYGNSYYNTRVGHKHKNLGDRDLLRECISEARRQKLRVLAYYSVDRDGWAGHLHPEWRMRDPDGKLVDEDRYPPEWAAMGFLCYNSPYRDYVRQQVEEILDYDIDGFHFDMLWFGHTGRVCYCQYCRPLFRKTYGIEMPEQPSWDDAWAKFLEFRYESNARFCEELRAFIRRKRPKVSVMYNYHGTPPNSWQEGMLPVKHRLISDYGTGEGYPMRLGHHYASFMSCFLSNLEPGTPWQGVTSRYSRNMSDKTVRPLADMTWETMTYLSHGGMPLFVDTPQDDGCTLDPTAYERMGAV
ncbi:MAG: family 10 glycosylhydrolase, partial [Acidobacteriaceae bacterium]|nr:family 10 glycosylhydrolase [Acidobacteriaceae bacterium]